MKRSFLLLLPLLMLIQFAFSKEERVLILGDSIPYNGGWPTLITETLRQKPEFSTSPIVNISVPSETLSGLSDPGHAGGAFPRPCLHDRLGRVFSQFKPTLILACYGMNDGLYRPLSPKTLEAFKMGVERLKLEADAIGAKVIFLTTPPFQVDQEAKNGQAEYDKTLGAFATWLMTQTRNGLQVIDIRPALKKAIAEEKKSNPQFVYAQDGIHPGERGHELIAEAICPGLSKLIGTPAKPKFPKGAEFAQAKQKQEQLRNEWLNKTMHKRPDIPGYHAFIPNFKAPQASISKWNKFECQNFLFQGRKATLIFPERALPGNPWIWTTQPFSSGTKQIIDIAMVGRGFTLVHLDMPDIYGSPKALDLMTQFYEYVTSNYGLSRRPVLEPVSSGGLSAFRWAALHPKWVSCIVANSPVCDIKSWPAGKGKGKGSKEDWDKLLAAYEMNEAQALAFKGNPVDSLAPLASAKIPVLIIARAGDTLAPYQENGQVLSTRYKKLGGSIKIITEQGDHTEQTLKDLNPVIDFILRAAKYPRPASIVCIGDSITEGSGVNPHERWSKLLIEKNGQAHTICNQGFSARTLLAKGDLPYTREPMYQNALNGKFDIAFIALGTNDSKPQNWNHKNDFIKDYTAIITDLRKSNPDIEIYCLKCVPSTSTTGIRGNIIADSVNPMIEQIAKNNKCKIIDLFTPLKDHPELFPDKVHPNAGGHIIMANEIQKAIFSAK